MTPDVMAMDTSDGETGVVVTLSGDVPDEQREAIRTSVVAMARRSAEASRVAVERNRVLNDMARRVNAPLRALIEKDGNAAAALAAQQDATNSDNSVPVPPRPDWPPVTFVADDPTRFTAAPTVTAAPTGLQVFGAPWHYQWQWHAGKPPTTSTQDRPNGRIELSTHADQNNNWSDAHGGFGVALTSERVQSAAGRSLRRTNYWYLVAGGSFGGNATVEGGMEMTAIESGTVLSSARDKRFRRRVSAGERDQQDEPGWETGESIQLDWVMVPHRVYTFNVGCWLFSEAHGGVGTASVGSAHLNGLVIALTADFVD